MDNKKGFTKIGSLLEVYLKMNGLEGKYQEKEIQQIWPEIVGPMFAKYTTRILFERGVVMISMSSALARNELLMAKSKLIKALNDRMGKKIIRDVIVR